MYSFLSPFFDHPLDTNNIWPMQNVIHILEKFLSVNVIFEFFLSASFTYRQFPVEDIIFCDILYGLSVPHQLVTGQTGW